ncbi:MAG: UvrD-helicase domain-containing protein [Candidatus Thiodiazotropha sp. (ex Dulcina madagascariensis)]|nr:UvrD-helicase domain-containing protein [Candidatus Thiodiazotropha sp. (ex Dulcina madagascariensis)]
MSFYADLHIHSKYSRATSRDCDLENLTLWGRKKGITVIGTGDFTHPAWIGEIKDRLVPAEPGLFRLRDELEKQVSARLPAACHGTTRFMLSVEISTIYKKGDKTRKIHHLLYAPTIEKAERINRALEKIGNLHSDGRPILGLDSRHLLEIVLEAGDDCYLVPAHIWTPWFAVLGSKSGFDSISECYGDLAEHVFAVETGLSSDPAMNWLISSLDRYRMVSNSDAHSPAKLGREACVFETDIDYFAMKRALASGQGYGGTLEFFPEEGKYHLDGHRKCGVRLTPQESQAHNGICPICKKPLTLGVMHRVQELADRSESEKPAGANDFASLVPLSEVISEIEGVGPASQKVKKAYEALLIKLGPELEILNNIPLEALNNAASSSLLPEAISRMRAGQVIREAGYDGEYGRIKLFTEQELKRRHPVGFLFDFEDEPVQSPATERAPAKQQPAGQKPESRSAPGIPATPQLVPDDVTGSNLSVDLDQALDSDQNKALDIVAGPLLIIAGPGSGKTRVLTHRVAHLITDQGVNPEACLTITFTRRAAIEMKNRLSVLLPQQWRQIPVMTFHALGYHLLQDNRVAAGLQPGFRVTGEAERQALLVESLALSAHKAGKMLNKISALKRRRLKPDADSEIFQAWRRLEQQREIEGWLDYDDLMLLSLALLQSDPGLRIDYQNKYVWVSVDEYQDIDELQYCLLRQLVPDHGNICAIGDPDQAIYGFRGADVGFFLRYEQDFPKARKIQLTRNYRSGESIVSASYQMIAPATLVQDRVVHALLEDTGKVVIHKAPSDKAEAEYIIQTIEQLLGGTSFFSVDSGRSDGMQDHAFSFADIAVLYRTEAQAALLEEAFARSGIPYQRHGHHCLGDQPQVQELLKLMHKLDSHSPVIERLRQAQAELGWLEDQQQNSAVAPAMKKLQQLAERCADNWERFLTDIHMGQDIELWDERADRCLLLTLHAAKGLEFPVVFIVGCEDGILPLKWGQAQAVSDGELAEERRLFYVGMTRAKDRLFLSHAHIRLRRGRVQEQSPSPFLEDIEQRLLEIRRHAVKKKTQTQATQQMELF